MRIRNRPFALGLMACGLSAGTSINLRAMAFAAPRGAR